MDLAETTAAIRKVLDDEPNADNIAEVNEKLLQLVQLTGLSAAAMARAKTNLERKRLQVLKEMEEGMPASIMTKRMDGECFEELGMFTYCDRLHSALVHSIDGLRSVISLYKSELENGLK